ncbi:PAS domain S-box protein [Chitinophagaceae bacterium MMS25-I14]
MPTGTIHTTDKFLASDSEISTLIKRKDWSYSPVGAIETWPQSLRLALGIVLHSKFPMVLFWGPELTCFYNDAFRPSLGNNGKHPEILGMPGAAAWYEVWDTVYPSIKQVTDGGAATWSEDQLIPIYRNGAIEEVYWTYSYSPVIDECGDVAGVFVVCNETTGKIRALQKTEESEERARLVIESSLLGTFDLDIKTDNVICSDRMREIFGFGNNNITHQQFIDAIHPDDRHLRDAAASQVQQTGVIHYEARIIRPDNTIRWIIAQGKMFYNEQHEPLRMLGTVMDTTEQKTALNIIRENEQKFRNTVMQAPVGITIFRGPEFIVEMANENYLQLVGRTEEQLVGKSLFEGLPEVQAAVEPLLKSVFETGTSYHGNEFKVTLNRYGRKEIAYFNFVYQAMRERNGSITGIIVIANEVTAQVAARHALQESEKQFRRLVTQSPIAMAIFRGRDFIIEMANETLLNNIWRRNYDEVIGRKLLDVFPELINQQFPALLHNVLDTGIAYKENEAPAYIDSHDGRKLYYLDFEYAPLPETDGKVAGIMVTVSDVTEKVDARQKITASELKFRLLADSVPQYIWTTDARGNITYFNQALYDFTGLTYEEVKNDKWVTFVHPDDRAENMRKWIEAVNTGQPYLFEQRFRKYDGEYRWQLSRALPQTDSNGNIQMWVGTSTDIHDHKLFTDELEKQVEERTSELKKANEDLIRSNSELAQFAYVASHDLQEPLRKIQTFASRILDFEKNNLSDKGKDYFNRMQSASGRMQQLIKDLLSYSATATGEKHFEQIDLNIILQTVKDQLRDTIEQKRAHIKSTPLPVLHVIVFQFEQLFTNLITNALKFSRPDTEPEINVSVDVIAGSDIPDVPANTNRNYYCITVTDNGIGFEPQFRDRIFQVFQRLHGKDAYEGTGIGLAICKKIMENHNGFITADSEEGNGATFNIYMPI